MDNLVLIPFSLRVLFAGMAMIISGLLAASLTMRALMRQRTEKLLYCAVCVVGFICVTVAWIFLVFTRPNILACHILLYVLFLTYPFAIYCLIKEKKYIYFVEMTAGLLLIPDLQFNSYGLIYYFLGLLILLIRAFTNFLGDISEIGGSVNRFTLKETLDNFEQGILIANPRGRIIYINTAFISLLNDLQIPTHDKVTTISGALQSKAYRLISAHSFVVNHNDRYLLIDEFTFEKGLSLAAHDVTEELALNDSIQATNGSLVKEEAKLQSTLDEVKAVARSQEKERLRSLVHDSFAEEVSFVHQILQNPKTNDLKPLKALVERGLGNYELTYQDITEMEHFYKLMGISFVNHGTLGDFPFMADALEFIREAIDNAIRHGNATRITITTKLVDDTYIMSVSNNGSIPKSTSPHNGLLHLYAIADRHGGKVTISTDPEFTITAYCPVPKGL